MSTVAQLIKQLKLLPPNAEVEVLREYKHSYRTITEFAPLDIDFGIDVIDYRELAGMEEYPTLFNKVFVHLTAIER